MTNRDRDALWRAYRVFAKLEEDGLAQAGPLCAGMMRLVDDLDLIGELYPERARRRASRRAVAGR